MPNTPRSSKKKAQNNALGVPASRAKRSRSTAISSSKTRKDAASDRSRKEPLTLDRIHFLLTEISAKVGLLGENTAARLSRIEARVNGVPPAPTPPQWNRPDQSAMNIRKRTNDEKIALARRLLQEVHCDERKRRLTDRQRETDAHKCTCGHARRFHLPTTSLNYTEGMCKRCPCQHFLITNPTP